MVLPDRVKYGAGVQAVTDLPRDDYPGIVRFVCDEAKPYQFINKEWYRIESEPIIMHDYDTHAIWGDDRNLVII